MQLSFVFIQGTAQLEDSEACTYHSETEHRLLIYMNESHLPADMFISSHWESQTRHQVASRTYRTMHTGGDSCLAWTFRRLATKPNIKNLKLFLNICSWIPCAISLQKSQHNMLIFHAGPRNPPVRQSLIL